MTRCPRHSCRQKVLGKQIDVEGRLFTLQRGVLPVVTTSLYCDSAFRRLEVVTDAH
jgi:hypothetical protein